jgi:hypothetical protein
MSNKRSRFAAGVLTPALIKISQRGCSPPLETRFNRSTLKSAWSTTNNFVRSLQSRRTGMNRKCANVVAIFLLSLTQPAWSQNLGLHFVKISDGIYVYARDAQSNCSIIFTQEVELLDETDRFYDVLLDRVGKLVAQGKSLDAIKNELRLPEYQNWSGGKERLDSNIEAAFRAVKK